MTEGVFLPDELSRAAYCLEQRLLLLRAPTRRIPLAEWEGLRAEVRSVVPAWIRELLASHALAGAVLECGDDQRSYERVFDFFGPLDFAAQLEPGSESWDLVEFGYLPIAYEADGSLWILRPSDGPMAEVFLLDRSDWNGAKPDKNNGLVFASSRLAFLDPSGPERVMWCPEGSE